MLTISSDLSKRRKLNAIVNKKHKTFNFDYITKEDIKRHSSYWQQILIIKGSGSRKFILLNPISCHPGTDQIFLCFCYSLWSKN